MLSQQPQILVVVAVEAIIMVLLAATEAPE